MRFLPLMLVLLLMPSCRSTSDGQEAAGLADAVVDPAVLDDLYGAAFPPAYAKAWETAADGTTITNPGLQVCDDTHKLTPDPGKMQIWIVLAAGKLAIGEEVEVGKDAQTGKVQRLGHPTLTGGAPARIAGELRWKNQELIINNKSGRYSVHPDRGKKQLKAAAALFATCGVKVDDTKFVDMVP